MIKELTKETFTEFISTGLSLVDFWAAWCGPCHMQLPIVEQVSTLMPTVNVGKVNVDDEPEIAAKLGISSIPYIAVFKNGVEVGHFIGLQQLHAILGILKGLA
jgi:thioredoxin 1